MRVSSFGRLALILCFAAVAGCALPTAPPAHHILVHKEGDPINGEKDKLTREQFKVQFVDKILGGIDAHVGTDPKRPPARLMLFVHGGLNTYRAGLQRVNTLVHFKEPSTDPGRWGTLVGTEYYPVFVNWNSSLWSSLWDDIFVVRREQRDPWKATVTAPFVLLSRVAEAGLSVPRSLWFFVEPEGRPKGSDVDETAPDKGPSYALLAPVRGVTVPFLDAFGTGAWEIMKRRAAFVTARGLPPAAGEKRLPWTKTDETGDESRQGAARTLLQALVARLCVMEGDAARVYWTRTPSAELNAVQPRACPSGEAGREVELTLVGHSMGALVVNRVLLGFPKVPFRRVVYLGAAASIDDLDTAVLPYLDRHPETHFHNVSLSMNDERYEKGWGDLWERGSLLVWIDNLFERVNSPQQLRLGRCLNLYRPAAGEPESTKARYPGRVFFHKFRGKTGDPRQHGGFDDFDKLPTILKVVEENPASAPSCGERRTSVK